MRFPRFRRSPEPPETEITVGEAQEAIEREERRSRFHQRETARARRLRATLRMIRENNHFSDLMKDAYRP